MSSVQYRFRLCSTGETKVFHHFTPTNLVIYKWVTCFMNIVTLLLPKVIAF